MANLIITVIAIALVAVASLMGAYYGGTAFVHNQQSADASTILNQGRQLTGSWQSYVNDNQNQPPADANSLIGQNYLSAWPSYPAAANTLSAPIPVASVIPAGDTVTHYYGFADLGDASIDSGVGCTKLSAAALGGPTIVATAADISHLVAGGADIGNNVLGCAMLSSNTGGTLLGTAAPTRSLPTAGHYIAYFQLS